MREHERRLRTVPGEHPPPGTGTPAERLLRLVAHGDAEAFEDLYDVVAAPVYGLALRIVRNPGMAEEVSQEVLMDVWRLAARFDPSRGSAMAWVMTLAHRRAVDRVRREESQTERTQRAGALAPEAGDDVAQQVERSLDAARVHRALGTLTSVQREAIDLAFFRGLTHPEVSAALGVPLGTAKTRIRDGLIKLRDVLGVE